MKTKKQIDPKNNQSEIPCQRTIFVTDSFWIGLSDFQDEGTWIWAQQKNPAQYTNWKPNEPNNSGSDENCALIYQDGKWNDGVCHNYAHYICEIKDE